MILAIFLVFLAIALVVGSIWVLGLLVTTLILTALILGGVVGLIVPLTLVQLPGWDDRVGRMLRASAAATLFRPTITFGDSTDLLLRRRTFDGELGREVVPGGDDQVPIENPGDAIHPWHGQPLTIVDEWFGVAFDPRHAAVGEKLRKHIVEGTLFVGNLRGWLGAKSRTAVPAYSEIPKRARRVALEGARSLLWGAEEGDWPEFAEEIYKKSQAGRMDSSRARQLLVPFAAMVLTYLMMWAGGEWGPNSGGSTIRIGIGGSALWLLLSMPRRPRPLAWLRNKLTRSSKAADDPTEEEKNGDGDRRGAGLLHRLLGLLVTLILLAAFAAAVFGVFLLFGPLVAGLLTVAFVVGTSLFPFGGFLLWWRLPSSLAETFANYYLRFGLLPFDDPVFEFGTGGYDVVDGAGSDVGGDARYRLATRWVGFDLNPDDLDELFDGLYEERSAVEARQPAAVADGGAVPSTTAQVDNDGDDTGTADAPTGYVASPGLEVEGVQGYVPKKPTDDVLYVRNDRAMSPYQYAQQGSRTYKAVEIAKEKYGAGWNAISDKWLFGLTIVFAVLGLIFGWLSFHA